MQIFDLVRRLALAAHFLVAVAVLAFTIAAFNSGGGATALLQGAFCIVFLAPLIPMSMRAWWRRSLSAANVSYITRTGSLLGTVFAVAALGLLLAAVLSGDGEDRLGAGLGAMLALWLSSLTMELSRRQ